MVKLDEPIQQKSVS